MNILLPKQKHSLDGIGSASAAGIMAALLTNPATAGFAASIGGRILNYILTGLFSWLASAGLVLMNVGAENLMTAIDKHSFDGSMESAEKLIDAIRASGRELTPEEIKSIDDKVKEAFRKFAKIGKKKKD